VALRSCAVAALLGVVGGGAAWAEDREPRDTRRQQSGAKVTDFRDQKTQDKGEDDAALLADPFQPKGLELGQFLLLPKVEVGEQYNSNVFGQRYDHKHDFITVVKPDIKLRSRFIEHELNLGFQMDDYRYLEYTDDNRTDFRGQVDGRFDFSGDTKATHYSQASFSHEDRTSPDAVDGKSPTPTTTYTNRTGIEHSEGRFKFSGEAWYDRKMFSATEQTTGLDTNNSDRDRWELQLVERASYEMFPGYSAIVELSENMHVFDRDFDRNGFDRDSRGYRAEMGIGVDISKLVRGDFLVGYMAQDFDDGRLKDVKGWAAKANFNWTPTKLTSVMPTLERTVGDTTTVGASGMVHTGLTLTIKHELARNIIVTGFGSASHDEFEGTKSNDYWLYEGGGTVVYSFMPEFYIGGEVKYKTKDAKEEASSFNQTTMMIKLGIQY
jgi:hypothetical protein